MSDNPARLVKQARELAAKVPPDYEGGILLAGLADAVEQLQRERDEIRRVAIGADEDWRTVSQRAMNERDEALRDRDHWQDEFIRRSGELRESRARAADLEAKLRDLAVQAVDHADGNVGDGCWDLADKVREAALDSGED